MEKINKLIDSRNPEEGIIILNHFFRVTLSRRVISLSLSLSAAVGAGEWESSALCNALGCITDGRINGRFVSRDERITFEMGGGRER